MSDVMLYGLDAMAHGAIIALLVVPPLAWWFWRLAIGLPRWRRIVLALAAAHGVGALLAGLWALVWERHGLEDEAMAGATLISLAILALATPILLIVSPPNSAPPTFSPRS